MQSIFWRRRNCPKLLVALSARAGEPSAFAMARLLSTYSCPESSASSFCFYCNCCWPIQNGRVTSAIGSMRSCDLVSAISVISVVRVRTVQQIIYQNRISSDFVTGFSAANRTQYNSSGIILCLITISVIESYLLIQPFRG